MAIIKKTVTPKKTEQVRQFLDSTGKPVGWSKGVDQTGWTMNPAFKPLPPQTRSSTTSAKRKPSSTKVGYLQAMKKLKTRFKPRVK
jgi:hypothetical protein